jgi:hypothetical protein
VSRSLATHLVVLLVGMGLGLGAVAVAQDRPTAAAAPADSRIVRELRITNQRLQGALVLLNLNRSGIDNVSKSLTGFSTPPLGKSIRDVLRQTCVNTANSVTQQGFC